MSTTTEFFITGATGYIGGTVLEYFLRHSDASSWSFTALVRSQDKADKLEKLGVKTILGSLQDLDIIEKAASEADVVIATADCDDLPGAEATLRGLKKRFEATGKKPIFINTSGTGVISVDSAGKEATSEIYDDMNADQIETLPLTQVHRPVDVAITNADKAGYVRTYIILPSTVYGLAQTRFVEAGAQNRHSIQVPALLSASEERGQGGMVGEGKNLWSNVEIHELANLYVTLYDVILAGSYPACGSGREGYYFGASEEHSLYDVGKAVSEALVKLGKAQSTDVTTVTQEEIDKFFAGSNYLGSNSRCIANRSRAIGWSPKKTTADFLASVYTEAEAMQNDGYKIALR